MTHITWRIAIAAALTATIGTTSLPVASAYPGDPGPHGCIWQLGSQLCDGPIRPNGTFQRCWANPGFVTIGPYGGNGVGAISQCEIVDPNNWPIIPIGAPHVWVGDQ
jgi:hypothetical protein